jgi:integrase
MTLGEYPRISLQRARELHRDARLQLKQGVNPARPGEAQGQNGTTFEDVALIWLAHWRQDKSERHAGYVERRMRADILPALGSRSIASIEALDVVRMAQTIEARGAHETARRALEVAGQIFRHGVSNGLAPRNPATDIKPSDVLAPVKSENFARVNASEVPALLRSINEYHGSAVTKIAMKLLAYTAVRTSELISAPWAEIDIEGARWEIAAQRTKMRDAHIVPLSRQAVGLFEALHQITGHTTLCFPGDRDTTQPMSNNTLLKMLERMGYAGRMTGHGWRGIFSTEMHEQGIEERFIEAALAHHKRDKVAAAYNAAKYLGQRRALMQAWADHLDQMQRGAKLIAIA